jgi:hypothetical protein
LAPSGQRVPHCGTRPDEAEGRSEERDAYRTEKDGSDRRTGVCWKPAELAHTGRGKLRLAKPIDAESDPASREGRNDGFDRADPACLPLRHPDETKSGQATISGRGRETGGNGKEDGQRYSHEADECELE